MRSTCRRASGECARRPIAAVSRADRGARRGKPEPTHWDAEAYGWKAAIMAWGVGGPRSAELPSDPDDADDAVGVLVVALDAMEAAGDFEDGGGRELDPLGEADFRVVARAAVTR